MPYSRRSERGKPQKRLLKRDVAKKPYAKRNNRRKPPKRFLKKFEKHLKDLMTLVEAREQLQLLVNCFLHDLASLDKNIDKTKKTIKLLKVKEEKAEKKKHKEKENEERVQENEEQDANSATSV